MTTRDYPAEGITVHWDSEVCIHSRVCAERLPGVFRPGERPWVAADAATPDQLAATIDLCPSGALRYTRTGHSFDTGGADEVAQVHATVTVHADGPLEVQGDMVVLAADGTQLRESRRQYFCRCGGSSTKPFCDGTHRRIAFTDDGMGERATT